jgi:hypothetical protein
MAVAVRVLEITRSYDAVNDGNVCRLWVIDHRLKEICVYVEDAEVLPAVGDQVLWRAGKIYFDEDRRHLVTVGGAFAAPVAEEW